LRLLSNQELQEGVGRHGEYLLTSLEYNIVNEAKAFWLRGKESGLNKTPNPFWLQYQS